MKLYQIKFTKQYDTKKVGDIVNCSKSSAETMVNAGYAEYLNKVVNKEKKSVDRTEEFKKFHKALMTNAPEGYSPWYFPCAKGGKNPAPDEIINQAGSETGCCKDKWVFRVTKQQQESIDTGKINKIKIKPQWRCDNCEQTKGSWKAPHAQLTKEDVIKCMNKGYNIGLSARADDKLIIIDIDEAEFLDQAPKETLKVTSRKRAGSHSFCWDKNGSAKLNLPSDAGEIRSVDQYVLACGSEVQFNLENENELKAYDKLPEWARKDIAIGFYTLSDAVSPKEIVFDEFPEFFKETYKKSLELTAKVKNRDEIKSYTSNINNYTGKKGKYTDLFNLKMSDIISPEKARIGHPLHASDTDANFSITEDGNLGMCWRHGVSLNAVQYLCVKAGYGECHDVGTQHKNGGVSSIKGDKEALEVAYQEALKMGLIEEYKEEMNAYNIFTTEGQVREFYKLQPFYYDTAKLFYLWNEQEKRWIKVDETEILNNISKNVKTADTINSKMRGEIIQAIKQIGREHKPMDVPRTWLQYKDKIVDILTGEEFEATSKYFVTNPIPHKLGVTNETPTIDKLLREWVVDEKYQDETYIKTLKQIIAYSCCGDQFLQRLIALCGGGMNGKGTFVKLLTNFIGRENTCTSDVRILAENNFETASLYKKQVCIMGEVDAGDLKNTNNLKKLSGEDDMRYEFKGKGSFSEPSSTTCLISTNSLPNTPDKSLGFYRRWLIVDFPHQFSVKRDLLGQIPDEEYENLGRCILELLKEMYDTNQFENEGLLDQRVERYEERSNPLMKFIEHECEEDYSLKIEAREFATLLNQYLKKKHLRVMSPVAITKALKVEGYEVAPRKLFRNGESISARFLIGIAPKDTILVENEPEITDSDRTGNLLQELQRNERKARLNNG